MSNMLVLVAGPAAYAAGALAILGLATLSIFFAGVPAFGPINDAVSALQMLVLVPVFLFVHRMLWRGAGFSSMLLTGAAVTALLIFSGLQAALAVGLVEFQDTLWPVMWLTGFLGVWWTLSGADALGVKKIPSGLAWASIATGVSFIAIATGFLYLGEMHPITAAGFAISAVANPLWSFWMGSLILRRGEQILG
ncbi:MAG: hypothetical protein ACLFWD_11790 [Anaerolineales bacterium]